MTDVKITFTYLNIRQSIVILLTKMVCTDLLLAVLIIGFYFALVRGETFLAISLADSSVFLLVFMIVGVIKIMVTVYIVLQWLNEYYEITPENILHKRGIIFRKTEMYNLNKIRAMNVQDTFWGELLNFATITLYDIRMNKYLDMYLIHNPQRYAQVLKELRPDIEIKEDQIRLPFFPKKKLINEYD